MDILIVEDNKELAGLLCDFLRAENYTVSAAQTAEKALLLYERYGARLADVVLTEGQKRKPSIIQEVAA